MTVLFWGVLHHRLVTYKKKLLFTSCIKLENKDPPNLLPHFHHHTLNPILLIFNFVTSPQD